MPAGTLTQPGHGEANSDDPRGGSLGARSRAVVEGDPRNNLLRGTENDHHYVGKYVRKREPAKDPHLTDDENENRVVRKIRSDMAGKPSSPTHQEILIAKERQNRHPD